MRLTHQSRYDAAKAARDSQRGHNGPKPWEPDFTRDRDADGTSGPDNTPEAPKATLPKRNGRDGAKERPSEYARRVLRLNADWAVSDDGEMQWSLLRARGGRWMPRRFHVERDALLRSVRELCGPVDAAAVVEIRGWPPMWSRRAAAAGSRHLEAVSR